MILSLFVQTFMLTKLESIDPSLEFKHVFL
jgi:hypothetical protein